MITPSFSLTATERVLPKLALDFTTASLDPRVTFTRTTDATYPATYVNSSGYIASASNNAPRFDYSPVNLACKGLLIEESRSNLCTYSEDYTNGAYAFTDISINSNQTAAPDNANTADLWTQGSAGTANAYRTSGITVSAGATITFSVFVKRNADMQWLRIRAANNANTNGGTAWFDLTNGVLGTVSNAGTGTNTSATITPYANGFYRLTVTTTVGAADTSVNRYIFSTTGDNTATRQANASYYMWGEQLEAGAFPTSYIPTTTTALTRNADVATMTGTNFSSWFNATEGTFVSEHVIPVSTGQANGVYAAQLTATPSTNYIGLRITAAGVARNAITNTTSVSLDAMTTTYGATIQDSLAYKLNNSAAAANANNPVTSSSVSIPTVDYLLIGSISGISNYLNGYVKTLYYYPQRLTNAEVQAFSK
jgi:hypothetical protein